MSVRNENPDDWRTRREKLARWLRVERALIDAPNGTLEFAKLAGKVASKIARGFSALRARKWKR